MPSRTTGRWSPSRASATAPRWRNAPGAAGLALECDGSPYGGGGAYSDGLATVQSDPEAAAGNLMRESVWAEVPEDGYVVERVAGHRVLLSYDVGEKTKVAFVVRDELRDWDDDVGWGVESWAQCDPAELPAEVTDDFSTVVWADAQGRRVPVATITSFQGAAHCAWQDITFLSFGPYDGHGYLRDVGGDLADYLTTTYSGVATLPENARDTGYRNDGRQLWLGDDPKAAYLVSVDDPDDVERWPATNEEVSCV